MKETKEKKGITLIALIITIILMLILAGVAVSAITAEGMPFGKIKNIAGQYNNTVDERQKAIDKIIGEMNNDYIGGGSTGDNTGDNETSGGNDGNDNRKPDGSYDTDAKVNSPDTSKLPTDKTKYVTWDNYTEQIHDTVPDNWYNYNNGQWANIKSTANDLEAYWVWIPRFAYRLPESETAKEIEVVFIEGTGTTGVNGETCYYATDTRITKEGSGLYKDATALAKGTEEGKEQAWIVHPAFWWDNDSDGVMEEGEQLAGIWVGKYASSPSTNDGGGDTTGLQVEIKPNVLRWRSILVANAFTVCENMRKVGGVVESKSSLIDTHMMKSIEWGSVAILSQSKYGVYNPKSANSGQVWYSSSDYTGRAGTYATQNSSNPNVAYNDGNGPKTSTTGTVYGVYDMAGKEYVMMNFIYTSSGNDICVGYTGFSGSRYDSSAVTGVRNLPDKKYYDLYVYGTNGNTFGFIGEGTTELKTPVGTTSWEGHYAYFPFNNYPLSRGCNPSSFGSNFTNARDILLWVW